MRSGLISLAFAVVCFASTNDVSAAREDHQLSGIPSLSNFAATSRFLRTNGIGDNDDSEERALWDFKKLGRTFPGTMRNDQEALKAQKTILVNQYKNMHDVFKTMFANGVTPGGVAKENKIAEKVSTMSKRKLKKDGEYKMWRWYSIFYRHALRRQAKAANGA